MNLRFILEKETTLARVRTKLKIGENSQNFLANFLGQFLLKRKEERRYFQFLECLNEANILCKVQQNDKIRILVLF